MDQPSVDGLNTYVIAGAVRDAGLKVALSGLGADELFGGYRSFRRSRERNDFWTPGTDFPDPHAACCPEPQPPDAGP